MYKTEVKSLVADVAAMLLAAGATSSAPAYFLLYMSECMF